MNVFQNKNSFVRKGQLPNINTTKFQLVFLLLFASATSNALSKEYKIPPTQTTNVPWITDAEMERCVKKIQ